MRASTGGQLMCYMLLYAQQEGLPMPARQYLCTPVINLTSVCDWMMSNADRDLMPVPLLIGMVKHNYQSDTDMKDPLYSPIYADFKENFPATVITAGTRDCMLSSGAHFRGTLILKIEGSRSRIRITYCGGYVAWLQLGGEYILEIVKIRAVSSSRPILL
jgi:acetyl esterase/lipase